MVRHLRARAQRPASRCLSAPEGPEGRRGESWDDRGRLVGWLIAAGLVAGLSACSWVNPPIEPQARLALACETVRCECRIPQSRFVFSKAPPVPIVWKSDGSASCPEGYLLSRASP